MGIEFANNITGTLSSVHSPKTKNDYLLTKQVCMPTANRLKRPTILNGIQLGKNLE
jgi:hypothetical protein